MRCFNSSHSGLFFCLWDICSVCKRFFAVLKIITYGMMEMYFLLYIINIGPLSYLYYVLSMSLNNTFVYSP